MNWKKIGLFVLFFVLGVIFLGVITILTSSSILTSLLLIAYVVFLVLILKEYSKRKMLIMLVIFIIYVLLHTITFPTCYLHGSWSSQVQDCTCIGFEKQILTLDIFATDGSIETQCVGIRTNYEVTSRNPIDSLKSVPTALKPIVGITNNGISMKMGEKKDVSLGFYNKAETDAVAATFVIDSCRSNEDGTTFDDPSDPPIEIVTVSRDVSSGEAMAFRVSMRTSLSTGLYFCDLRVVSKDDQNIEYEQKKIVVNVED